jgi:glycosyltransferase involved in cell wall biosynthesis
LCDSTRQYFESIFDLGDIRRSVIAHGVERRGLNFHVAARSRDAPIRFAFLGPCVDRNNWDAIEACFRRILQKAAERIRLTVYGDTSATTRLAGLPGVNLNDNFPTKELNAVLGSCDVGLVSSRFETFCRECYEMLARGIPVIGSDAFGIRDVLAHRRNGLQIGWPTADALETAVRLVLDEDGLLETLNAGAANTAITSPDEEFSKLLTLYKSHLESKRVQ